MIPRTFPANAPNCIGVWSLSQSIRPSGSKIPAPRSSDSRMMLENAIRQSADPISFAIESSAPPITRSVTLSIEPAVVVCTASASTGIETSRFPLVDTVASKPGGRKMVESSWTIRAGPAMALPALRSARS